MTPSIEGWPIKVRVVSSPHEVRLALLDTNPVLQCLGEFDSTGIAAVGQFHRCRT